MSRKEKQKRKKTFGDFLSTLIIIIALGVFAFAGYKLFLIWQDYQVGVNEYNDLEKFADAKKITGGLQENMKENNTLGDQWGDVALDEEAEQEKYEEMENPIDFASLKAINNDVIGWLEMEAVDINYPIAQGDDNEFYLHQTIQKTYNFAGSIFVDCLNRRNFGDRNTIVYGHNMKNGSMFGLLKRYKEQETYDKSPYFWIYTPNYIYKYEIFSCAEVDKLSKDYQISFISEESFRAFIERSLSQSILKMGVDVDMEDTVVTLSTCTGNEATRFIVQGKRVRTYQAVPKAGGYETESESAQ